MKTKSGKKRKVYEAWAVTQKVNPYSMEDFPIQIAACCFTPKDETETLKPWAIFYSKWMAQLCKKMVMKKFKHLKLKIEKVTVTL
jgi:hypothetical protein